MNYNNISRHKLMVISMKKKHKTYHRDNKCTKITTRDSTYILILKIPRLMI